MGKKDVSIFKKTVYQEDVTAGCTYMLAGNIGGTSTRLALVELDKDIFRLLMLLKTESKKITDFSVTVDQALRVLKEEYGVPINHACFAVAGPVSPKRDFCQMINVPWAIDTKKITGQTMLETAVLMNDFESIGYGIDALSSPDYVCINASPKKDTRLNKAVIGAGTGLGKSIITWCPCEQRHLVIAAEGGHADFPVHNAEELELVQFIQKERETKTVEWEYLLSGRGIQYIYRFLAHVKKIESPHLSEIEKSEYDPKTIASHKDDDPCCKKTFQLFAQFYGRCAKNTALESLSLGGIYLAGGIAQKNIEIFKADTFLSAFYNNQTLGDMLKKIPVYVIMSPHVELYGAIAFGRRFAQL